MIDPANWKKLAAPIPSEAVQWRQQGKPKQRDGKWFAPFVAYIDAQLVRERFDSIFEGQWNTALELLPTLAADANGEALDEPIAFKCRLTVCGVMREDVGTGRDYKTASTDAFKRAAVRYGVGHELYTDYDILWVQVDSDSKFAKPVEDPGQAYARRLQRGSGVKSADAGKPHIAASTADARQQAAPEPAPAESEQPVCPKCGGSKLWDNRAENAARVARGEKARPDWKCKATGCDGVIWPPRDSGRKPAPSRPISDDEVVKQLADADDGLPF